MHTNLAHDFLLREDIIFLNHGSFGACPAPVFADYQDWQRQLEAQPVEFLGRRLTELMRVPRLALAAELGADADDLVGVTNATTGLNIVARSLPLRPGDQILTTDHEYAALEKTWTYVAARTGAEIVTVTIPLPLTDAGQFTEAILAGITERTRVLFLSHITSPTALIFPLQPVVAEARRRGIWTVIDGAHAPGQIPLDLGRLGADFYSGNCHKWLMAPKGSAFLHARPEVQHLLDPLVISHGWTDEAMLAGTIGPFGNPSFIDRIEMQGTRDPAPWLAVPAAIEYRRANHWPAVQSHCQQLAWRSARRLAERTGLPPLSTADLTAPQMVAMPLPPCDTEQLKRDLLDRFRIEIPVHHWRGRPLCRVSVQGYNTQDQLDTLIDALTELLRL